MNYVNCPDINPHLKAMTESRGGRAVLGWGQLTWVSVSISEVATSKRLGRDRYLLSLNWCSSSSSCWLVKAVRGRRHFPRRFDCAWAAGGGERVRRTPGSVLRPLPRVPPTWDLQSRCSFLSVSDPSPRNGAGAQAEPDGLGLLGPNLFISDGAWVSG